MIWLQSAERAHRYYVLWSALERRYPSAKSRASRALDRYFHELRFYNTANVEAA